MSKSLHLFVLYLIQEFKQTMQYKSLEKYVHILDLDLNRKIKLNLILGYQFMLWDFLALNAY